MRWIALTGLRGTGKSTIMYQLFEEAKKLDAYVLALSVDEVVNTMGSNIHESIEAFEEIIGKPICGLDKPLFLFLDEVQYDKNWGSTLKIIYDKSFKTFIFSTGSSAILINSNADIARRAIYEKMFPLSFVEFNKIKNEGKDIEELSIEMRKIFFESLNAKEVFEGLKSIENKFFQYSWTGNKIEFEKYLHYGSLPFMINLENESIVYDQIKKSVDRVINIDIGYTNKFESETINKIFAILYAIADMDLVNILSLSRDFEISRAKMAEIFSLLEQAEVLHRIFPMGSHCKQVTQKPSKYLFSSPSFRAMFYKTIGNTITEENARGKLLEDLVGMYLYRLCDKNPIFSLTYDSLKGGADFIISMGKKRIVIEVGVNKQEYKQARQTVKSVGANYGVIISEKASELEYNEEANTVKIPLKYFILM